MTSNLRQLSATQKSLITLLTAPPISAELNISEITAISGLEVTQRDFPADTIIINQGDRFRCIHLIQNGWGCVYRDLSNGERQILDFPIRSDFVGLRTADGYSYNTISAITVLTAFEIPVRSFATAIERAPKLSFMLIELFARQRSMLIEHLTNIGCRSALVRTAHLLLEMSDRAKACGMGDESGYFFPVTQYQLADALGLTPIHMNRMLKELRVEGLLQFRNNHVQFLNRKALVNLAEYDGQFMNMSVFEWSAAIG